MFVDTFIKRPILASVCSLVLILAGAIAIPTMPIAQYPVLAPPQITVTAIYTGANAQEVETAVTTPLEQSINGVEGMIYMQSSSTNSGVSTINVTFDVTLIEEETFAPSICSGSPSCPVRLKLPPSAAATCSKQRFSILTSRYWPGENQS